MPVEDIDLDVISYEKTIKDGDSLIYIRTWKCDNGDDMFNVIHGEVHDAVNALLEIQELTDVIMFCAAYYIKNGIKIDDYSKHIIDENDS